MILKSSPMLFGNGAKSGAFYLRYRREKHLVFLFNFHYFILI